MLTGQYYADNSNATFNLQKDSSFTFHWSGGCVMKDEATGYYTFKNNVVTFYYGPAKIDTTITHYNKVNYHLQPAVASEAHGAAVVHNTILANALLIADTVPVIDTGYTQSDLHNYKATRPLKLYYFNVSSV